MRETKFPAYPENNQEFTNRGKVYRYYLNLKVQDFVDLIIRNEHGCWIACTNYREIEINRNPNIYDNPTEFMQLKNFNVIHWVNTDLNVIFSWNKQMETWLEISGEIYNSNDYLGKLNLAS